MTKRTMQTLGLLLLATPLVAIGCGGSDNNGGTGGGGGGGGTLKYDGAAGTGGSHLDGGPTPTIDGAVVDATIVDAPVALDGSALDVAAIDTHLPGVDVAAVDTTPAIDTTPVVVVTCTETKKFAGGAIAADRTLTKACSPYEIKNSLNLEKGATLTIEPGTTLKFSTNTQLYVYAGAILNAVGTAAEPVTLTSAKSVPAAGDWNGVAVQNGGNSITLKYVTVEYAGYGGAVAVDITNSTADVENCIVRNNAYVGLDSTASLKGTKVLANTFYSNGDVPLVISDGVKADATNTFHSGTLVNDKQFVSFAGAFSSTRTLDITEVPYLFGGNANIEKTANVTVNPGVTLAFASDTQLYVYAGAVFSATGTATSPVTFTSAKTSPVKGDWDGLSFQNSASAITIKYATIQYAGFGSVYAVDATNSTFDIENCTIQHNLNGGLDGTGAKRSTLKDNSFTDNNADATTIVDWTIPDATNTISGNTPPL